MDQKWNRFRLFLFLTFLRNVSGFKGWAYLNTQPQWSKPYQYTFSPRGVQSPAIGGSVPFEVGSVFTDRNQNPSRSQFSLSHPYIKDGVSSSYDSRSRTRAAPSGPTSASRSLPQSKHNPGSASSQGSSSLNVQDVVSRPASRWGSHKYADSRYTTGPQSASVSAPYTRGGSGAFSGLSLPSQSTSGTVVSQSSSQALRKFPSQASALGSSQFDSKQRGSDRYSGLSPSPSASGHYTPLYATMSSAQSPVSPPTRASSSFRQFSPSSQGSKLSASNHFGFAQGGSSSSHHFRGTSSQFTPGSLQYVKMPQSQTPQRWQPSTSMLTQGIQTSGTAVSPQSSSQSQTIASPYTPTYVTLGSSPLGVTRQSSSDERSSSLYTSSSRSRAGGQKAVSSRYMAAQERSSSSVDFSLQPQDTPSQYVPEPSLGRNVPVSSSYNQASSNGPPLFQKWQNSAARLTQGLQTSGTAVSPSNLLSQSSRIQSSPSRMSLQSSAGNPSQIVSTEAGSHFSGSSPPNMFCPFMQGNAKLGSSRD